MTPGYWEELPEPAIACDIKAIGAGDRPRYEDLLRRLRLSIWEQTELADGYLFRLNENIISLPDVAGWITMERRCCPFLTLEVSASGSHAGWILKLTGPTGIKPILQAEFPQSGVG